MMLFKILIIKEIQLTSQFVAYLIFALAGIWVEVLFCLLALVVLRLGFGFSIRMVLSAVLVMLPI